MTAAPARTTYVLIDGENIDATLGQVFGRRPAPQERPRWDRLLEFAETRWGQPAVGLFFLAVNGELPMGFVQALMAMGFRPVPLAGADQKLDVVLQLTADDEELVTRLLGRAKETGRSDDNEGVIRHRLDLYHEQTEPVVAKYAERGILTQVDGIGRIDEVTERVMEAIKSAQAA